MTTLRPAIGWPTMVSDLTANPFKAHPLQSALPIGVWLLGTMLMGVEVARYGSN
jgi:hypothetical protein